MESYCFGTLVAWSSLFYFKLCRGTVTGLDNIPDEPCIIAANHVSYIDRLFLHSVFRLQYKRKIEFIAKKELFKPFAWRLLMIYSGSIYIDQDRPRKETIKNIRISLKKKQQGNQDSEDIRSV